MWDIWNMILSHLLSWVILYLNRLSLYFLSRKTKFLFIETIYIWVYLIGIIYIVCLTFHLVGTRLEMYMNTLSRFNPSCHLTNGVKLSQLKIVKYPSYNTSLAHFLSFFFLKREKHWTSGASGIRLYVKPFPLFSKRSKPSSPKCLRNLRMGRYKGPFSNLVCLVSLKTKMD